MKHIRKIRKKTSLSLKLAAAFVLVAVLLSFYIGLKYAGKVKDRFPALTLSTELLAPVSENKGGFYENSFLVSLTSPAPNMEIYYTLDGSQPDLSSTKYSTPFELSDRTIERNNFSAIPTSPRWKPPLGNVFKGTVLRAIVVNASYQKSEELKRTYFVFGDKQRYSLPVLSVIIDPVKFFGYNKGIYVLGKTYTDKDVYIRKRIPLNLSWWEYPANYMQRGQDEERSAYIEFYEPEGRLGFSSNVGIRINGNATRGLSQKSLRITMDKKSGNPVLNYDLFPGNSVKTFNSFILRNSGNDWNKTMFRDAFMQSLMEGTHVDVQDSREAVVFVNGEYWGIHNIRERFDQHYLAYKYKLNPDSVTILELNGRLVKGEKNEENAFAELIKFAKNNDLSKEVNYAYICSQIDILSFQDFVISNVYFCNSDWPNNNVKYWKFSGRKNCDSACFSDGRWRWMLYDTDWGFGYNASSAAETDLLKKASRMGNIGVLFGGLLKNEKFKAQFLGRFQEFLNTRFNAEFVLKKIEEFEAELQPEMQEHINRWRAIESLKQWESNVEELKDFARKRPSIQADQLNSFFNLKGGQQISVKTGARAY